MDTPVLLALLVADVGLAAVCAQAVLRGLRGRRAAPDGHAPQEQVATVDLPRDSVLDPARWVPGRAALVLADLRLNS